jgi:hypothetical protein
MAAAIGVHLLAFPCASTPSPKTMPRCLVHQLPPDVTGKPQNMPRRNSVGPPSIHRHPRKSALVRPLWRTRSTNEVTQQIEIWHFAFSPLGSRERTAGELPPPPSPQNLRLKPSPPLPLRIPAGTAGATAKVETPERAIYSQAMSVKNFPWRRARRGLDGNCAWASGVVARPRDFPGRIWPLRPALGRAGHSRDPRRFRCSARRVSLGRAFLRSLHTNTSMIFCFGSSVPP